MEESAFLEKLKIWQRKKLNKIIYIFVLLII